MDSAVGIVVGAAISGSIGLLVVFLQQYLLRTHEADKVRAGRLGEFSAAGWAGTLIVSELARAAVGQKKGIENSRRYQAVSDRFNAALAQIQLLYDGEVYVCAHRVDECLASLISEARTSQFSSDSWRQRRAELSQAVADFQRAARAALGTASLDRPEPWLARAGRPAVTGSAGQRA